MQPICLITGASAGIGAALARVFALHGHALVLTARREAQMRAHADAIAAAGHKRPQVIAADLGAADGPARLAEALERQGLEPEIVVNNAGYGLFGAIEEINEAEARAQIETNLFGALWVTQAALPFMRA